MQTNELKAVLSKTNVVAIVPVHIQDDSLPYWATKKYAHCPSGLTKAKVLEDGKQYIEKRTVGQCGDRDYEIPRRNGVLVEIDPEDLKKKADTEPAVRARLPNLKIIGKKEILSLLTPAQKRKLKA